MDENMHVLPAGIVTYREPGVRLGLMHVQRIRESN